MVLGPDIKSRSDSTLKTVVRSLRLGTCSMCVMLCEERHNTVSDRNKYVPLLSICVQCDVVLCQRFIRYPSQVEHMLTVVTVVEQMELSLLVVE